MARKAMVDREKVLQLLREGQTSQSIAGQFGVSRQAIDLHRKEFLRTGALDARVMRQPAPTVTRQSPPPLAAAPAPRKTPKAATVSLDQMIDLLIQSFAAMKKLPELELEVNKLKQQYETALAQLAQMEEREKKRLEQEARWREAQTTTNPNT